jgi:hypothetical protein
VADTATVTVVDGWAVFADGEQRTGGSVVDVPVDLSEQWEAAGWVTRGKKSTARRRPTG